MRRFTAQGDTLVCFDFDETYFPHQCTEDQLDRVRELEDFLEMNGHLLSTIWVTGSSAASLKEKARRANLRYWPHRIAASLGTEVYQVNERGGWELDEAFHQVFPQDFAHRVARLVDECTQQDIVLERQPGFARSKWIRSYYYIGDDPIVIEKIAKLAGDSGIGVNISKCNPLAGDPEGAYDVDFIPQGAGKAASIRHVSARFGFSLERAFAFGDSGNDLEMLQLVEHGYVLQNGTDQAKSTHRKVTDEAYAAGILEVLRQINFT